MIKAVSKSRLFLGVLCAVAFAIGAGAASAQVNIRTRLNDEGNTAVNNVKAGAWLTQANHDNDVQKYTPDTDKIVNLGSASKGTCNLNVAPQQDPLNKKTEVVVAKQIINVCGQ